MKKLFLALLAFVAMGASAQTKDVGEITWTPQISVGYINAANYKGYDEGHNLLNYKSWIGASVGFGGKYQVSENFGVKAAVTWLYSKSSKDKMIIDGEKLEAYFDASYIEIPILASYDLSKNLGIQLGLKPAFQTSYKTHMKLDGESESRSVADQINKFQLYIPVGLTYQFNSPLSVGLHYNFPLTKVNKEETITGKDIKFNQFLLTLGWDL